MSKLTKQNVIKFFRRYVYWASLLLVLIMIDAFTSIISSHLGDSNANMMIITLTLSSLILTTYSIFIAPVGHFLDAQFEYGKTEDFLEEMHDDVKKVKIEVDEIKRTLNQMKEEQQPVEDVDKNGS